MKLYPFMPIVYILAYLFVSVSIVIKDPWAGLLGAGLLGFFYIMYKVGKWRNAR
jgi:APA family basic amino acid/polyamine antiporter